MLEFNLKKKQARKELYYEKNNFVAELGIELINKKTDLILHKPNSSILFDERLKVKDSSKNDYIINDINFPWQEAGFGRNRTVSSWKKLGIISRNKKFMASDNTKATLLLPQGLKGPKFLAYSNYNIYLKWNDSFIYTVTAAHLASRFLGQKKFLSNKPDKILSLEKMIKLQNILQSNGYNVGKVDGILGRQTRQSVRTIQIKLGLPADSWPTADLFNTLN